MASHQDGVWSESVVMVWREGQGVRMWSESVVMVWREGQGVRMWSEGGGWMRVWSVEWVEDG